MCIRDRVQALKDESSFKSKANTKHIHHYHQEQPAGVMLPKMCIRDRYKPATLHDYKYGRDNSYKIWNFSHVFYNVSPSSGAQPVSYTHLDVYKRQVLDELKE